MGSCQNYTSAQNCTKKIFRKAFFSQWTKFHQWSFLHENTFARADNFADDIFVRVYFYF